MTLDEDAVKVSVNLAFDAPVSQSKMDLAMNIAQAIRRVEVK